MSQGKDTLILLIYGRVQRCGSWMQGTSLHTYCTNILSGNFTETGIQISSNHVTQDTGVVVNILNNQLQSDEKVFASGGCVRA